MKKQTKNVPIIISIILIIISIIFILVLITKCTSDNADTSHVNKTIETSIYYTKDEIDDAMNTVIKDFKETYRGCTLIDLWHTEDEENASIEKSLANEYNANQAIIIYGNFKSGLNVDSGITPNNNYNEFKWILIKNSSMQWEIKDRGY